MHLAEFWFDGGKRVVGWHDGELWNGWGCPKFDRDRIGEACEAVRKVGLRVTRDGDTVTIIDPETDIQTPCTVPFDGQMWDFGCLCLTWNHEPYDPNPTGAGEGTAEPWG